MKADEAYRRYLLALIERDTRAMDDLHRLMDDEPPDVPEDESITCAIRRAQDDYVRRRWPRLRKNIGDLSLKGEDGFQAALLLDRIFFGDPEIE